MNILERPLISTLLRSGTIFLVFFLLAIVCDKKSHLSLEEDEISLISITSAEPIYLPDRKELERFATEKIDQLISTNSLREFCQENNLLTNHIETFDSTGYSLYLTDDASGADIDLNFVTTKATVDMLANLGTNLYKVTRVVDVKRDAKIVIGTFERQGYIKVSMSGLAVIPKANP